LAGLCIVAEELGAVGLASPLLPSVTTGALVLAAAGTPLAQTWLPRLASGQAIATSALLEGPATNEWTPAHLNGAARGGGGWVLSGTKTLVPYAEIADVIVVTGNLEGRGEALLLVERRNADALRCSRLTTIGADPQSEVTFDGVSVTDDNILATNGDALSIIGAALDAAAVASVAYAVGLSRTALALAADYLREREQFGRKLGSLQGVAFRCADMRGDIDACRLLAQHAAWLIDNERPATLDVAAAKAYANQAVQRVFTAAHQLLGARGFSFESDLHLFSMRAKAFELTFGSTGFHHERVAVALGL
jgi:alkylation response protein AidB-like acyl-CoA dehydrogenase